MVTGKILKVSGPLVVAEGMRDANMFDVVRVGRQRLIGEIIEMHGDRASIQVYEETAGLGRGDEVVSTGAPLSVELGPGMVTNIFDGIQRPLAKIYEMAGPNIPRGIDVPALDRKKKWGFTPTVKPGDKLIGGDIIGEVRETEVVTLKIMLPPNISGEIVDISAGEFTVTEVIGHVKTDGGDIVDLTLLQKWPVRFARPYIEKLPPNELLVTGQRNVDAIFPIAKGGTACIPGPFGSGKTVVQHQLAKWSAVDIVVYVGCGERGNEMTDVLNEFPTLKDPRSGHSLMKRTVLVANTSDMPVAAREASIYTGITIAEFYRDMGYDVAIIADSTSRWAEALREMSGRLEEMPGEEGFPAYLTSRLAQFYERAGAVICQGSDRRTGSLSAIGAVSPQGGDLSEPVTQATLRIVKVFWGLDSALAYRRHFPAINWLRSYSLYKDRLEPWYLSNLGQDWIDKMAETLRILQIEAELDEIVKLVGIDALSSDDRLIMETARSIREDFLQQDSFDPEDSYCSLKKQYALIKLVLSFHDKAKAAVDAGADLEKVVTLPVREKIGRAKTLSTFETDYPAISAELDSELEALVAEAR
ncbi:MAG: V-type ATP synthase subunit A [Clostridiales bacterium]|nr:V-type ATP synthase subunit A [Clostridiales bacterium]